MTRSTPARVLIASTLRFVIHAVTKPAQSEEIAPTKRRAIDIPSVNVIATSTWEIAWLCRAQYAIADVSHEEPRNYTTNHSADFSQHVRF